MQRRSKPLLEYLPEGEAIAVNSTPSKMSRRTRERASVGSKWLLNFSMELGWPNYTEIRDAAEIVQLIPFSSDRKAMGAVVRHAHG
jgi:Ca2+-transporting ATPase